LKDTNNKVTRNIALLGSTGSIGKNTLEIVRNNRDKFKIVSLACGNNVEMISSQIREFDPLVISVGSGNAADNLSKEFPEKKIYHGNDGMMEAVNAKGTDTVVTATSGTHSIHATLDAIRNGYRICLANKETLVVAGELVNEYLSSSSSEIIPIDSEQSAIFQCIKGNDRKFLKKVILTASGGPFFNLDEKGFKHITVNDALNHPVWSMGKKITIDSSTLVNKALEIIEAFYLFKLDISEIDLLIHPQSIVHSMVEFIDNSTIAQMGVPDMKIPIQYSLSYPERFETSTDNLDLSKTRTLSFFGVDKVKFPSIEMAFDVISEKKNSGLIFNVANEVAVEYFLRGDIPFTGIFNVLENMVKECERSVISSADELTPMINEVKKVTEEYIRRNTF